MSLVSRVLILYSSKLSTQRTILVFIFIKIFFFDNTFRQELKFDCAEKNILPRTDEHGPYIRKQEIMLHVVGFIW